MSTREEYEAFFEHLKIDLASRSAVSNDWVGYFFHHTDVQNAASILTSRQLLSRNLAQSHGKMKHDNAESSIIDGTNKDVSDYSRLYFRPRTPTFYHNEGFRSRIQLAASSYSAHCPMPIALVFDAARILSLPGVRFSDRNLAIWSDRSVIERTHSGIHSLRSLPFDAIYHSGTLYSSDPNKSKIIQHRNAEIVIPDSLHLDETLVAIRCRSDAELETLRTLLPPNVWSFFKRFSGVNSDGSLFFATRYFIERVSISDGSLIIRVHNDTDNRDNFTARIRIEYEDNGAPGNEYELELEVNMGPVLKIGSNLIDMTQVVVIISIYLDDHLAYKGKHWLNEDALIPPF